MSVAQWRNVLERLTACSNEERWFAARAWLAAPVVGVSLRTLGLQRTLRWIEQVPRKAATSHSRTTVSRGAELTAGVYRHHWIRGQCLPKSLVQYLLHRRDGQTARFVIGVRRGGEALPLDAHAWVEANDESGQPFFRTFSTG